MVIMNKLFEIVKKLNKLNMYLVTFLLVIEAIICLYVYMSKDFIAFKEIWLLCKITSVVAVVNIAVEYAIAYLEEIIATRF